MYFYIRCQHCSPIPLPTTHVRLENTLNDFPIRLTSVALKISISDLWDFILRIVHRVWK